MLEIINNYERLKLNIGYYISISGYKKGYLAEQLGISRIAFYNKEKKGNFTFEQIKKLSYYLFTNESIKKTEAINSFLQKSLQESKEGKTIPNNEVKRSTNA